MLKAVIEEDGLHAPAVIIVLYIAHLFLTPFFQGLQCLVLQALAVVQIKVVGFLYLFNGANMIDRAYVKAKGDPFVIQTPGKKNVMVTSSSHIRELNAAPLHQLSLHAVAKDFLQPKHTMHGFEWKDQRGVEGTGFVRALRSLLTSHLPNLLPTLKMAIEDQFRLELDRYTAARDYHQCPVFATAKKIVTRTNSVVFFGLELSNNSDFVEAALRFPEDVSIAAEILRVMPCSIAPFIASLITRGHRSSTTMYNMILPIVEARLQMNSTLQSQSKPGDGIQWLMDTSPKRDGWTATRIVGEIMAIWYGSVHTLAIATSYAIIDLYSHPEYIEPLRNEVQGSTLAEFERKADGFPLLDSFLKESARLSAFESTGVRRQALIPFRFSDGLCISSGDWVCVPHRSMMRDSHNFQDPLQFDAFRSVREREGVAVEDCRNKLTDASDTWLVWGTGRILCPGRFYATLVLKLVLSHMLRTYDCELEKIKGSRSFQWRSAIIPKGCVTIRIRRRGS